MNTHDKDLHVWWAKEGWERTRVNSRFCKAAERSEKHVKGERKGIGCSGTRVELRFALALLLAM